MALPALVPLLWGGLLAILTNVVYRIFVAIGIGFVTFVGITVAINNIKSELLSSFSSFPTEISSLLSYMKVGVSINIIFSAIAARLVLAGLDKASGSITNMVFKK